MGDTVDARHEFIHDVIARWASETPCAIALIDNDDAVTYASLAGRIAKAKDALRSAGVASGHRVLLVVENCASAVAFVFAVSELQAWAVLVNARLSAAEIDAIAEHCEPQVEVYAGAGYEDSRTHAQRRGGHQGTTADFPDIIIRVNPSPTTVEPDHQDVAAVIYTSGTTGQPKGVMLTHRGLLFIAQTMADCRCLRPTDKSYAALPMSHTMGLTSVMLSTLVAGGTVVQAARFDVRKLVDALERGGVTLFQGVQAMYSALLAHLRAANHKLSAPALRYIYAGGSPLDPTLKSDVEALFGLPLHNGYGMTESSPTICHSRYGEWRKDASVGPPIPGVSIRVVSGAGEDLAVDEPGELWVGGPGLMKGYFRDPQATAAALRDGWLRTGDLALRDADGNVHLVGRLKDIIIRSGFNVYPAEVESALNSHPAVEQSAVVGRSVSLNEEVVAYVQLRRGQHVGAAELQAHLKPLLSPYKRPSEIVFLDVLPTLANGKVKKAALKELAGEPASGLAR